MTEKKISKARMIKGALGNIAQRRDKLVKEAEEQRDEMDKFLKEQQRKKQKKPKKK